MLILINVWKGVYFLRIYIVQKDDTLYKIAKKHHVQLEDIIKLNPHIANPDYIVPGMKIKLPNYEGDKKETGKAMSQKEKEQRLNARTNERPLGPVTEMDDRGAWEMQNRIPLTKREYSLGNSQHKSEKGHRQDPYEKPQTPNQQIKTYSNRQYVPLHEEKRRNQRQMHESATMPYANRVPQMDNPYMHQHMMMSPTHTEQPYYCPCCMYHWQMQQLMMHRYNDNDRPKPQQRIYY